MFLLSNIPQDDFTKKTTQKEKTVKSNLYNDSIDANTQVQSLKKAFEKSDCILIFKLSIETKQKHYYSRSEFSSSKSYQNNEKMLTISKSFQTKIAMTLV